MPFRPRIPFSNDGQFCGAIGSGHALAFLRTKAGEYDLADDASFNARTGGYVRKPHQEPKVRCKGKAPAYGDRGSKDGRRGEGRLGDTFRREVNFFS